MSRKNIVILAILLLAGGYYYWSRLPRYGTGSMIADFEIVQTDGKVVKLSDLRGKPVLIHFWGSWCGPCRQENPMLSDLYKTYHDKGLEIISIAIERNPDGWAKAIERDGINWPMHVMESGNFDGALATQFNVHAIPALFLVNKSGALMASNPSIPVLGRMVMEQCR